MDFIPLPQHSLGHVIIPDLGGPEYDQEEFSTFPQRCGWDLRAVRMGETDEAKLRLSVNEEPRCRIDQCIQTWIFWGTMSLAFRHPIPRTRYSRLASSDGHVTDDNARVLSTEAWLADLRPPNQRSVLNHADEQNKQALEDALDLSALVLLDLTRIKSDVLPSAVHLHLAVHVYFLQYLGKMNRPSSHVGSVFASSTLMFDFRSILMERGWCPNLVERISATGTPGLYYCSRMVESPDAGSGRSHTDCSDAACVALNIDEATYETRHVDPSCTCQSLSVSTDDLVRLIRRKEVPVVEVHENVGRAGAEVPTLVVKSASESNGYVAISHVWSDGLGNVNDNTMPTCQMVRISRLARIVCQSITDQQPSTDYPQALWMDTLCVPVSPMARTWRTEAIRRMGDVYRSAKAVLVLDQTMMRVSESGLRDEETLIRIGCCNWMTRLWTLQEGALANSLFFQFKDRAVHFNVLKERNERRDVLNSGNFLAHRAASAHIDVFSLNYAIKRYTFPLAAVWESLSSRTTSHEHDTPVCVGTLIGLDVKQLIESDNIMEEFWKMQKASIPTSILWVNGERLSGDGFKWAPASLLQPRSIASSLTDKCERATWDPRFGLTVTGILAHRLRYVWTPQRWDKGSSTEGEPPFEYVVAETKQRLKVFLSKVPSNGPWSKVNLHLMGDDAVLLLSKPVTPTNQVQGVLVACVTSHGPSATSKVSWRAAVHIQESEGHFERVKGYPGVAASSRAYSRAMAGRVVDPATGQVRDAEGEAVDMNHTWMIR